MQVLPDQSMNVLVRFREPTRDLRLRDPFGHKRERRWNNIAGLLGTNGEINRSTIQTAGGARLKPPKLKAKLP